MLATPPTAIVPPKVETPTFFYAIDNKHGVRFDIFKMVDERWQYEIFFANPGDRIGNLADTGWTLTDVREDPSGNNASRMLILLDGNGNTTLRQI